ncbi:hypothetical protein SGADD02_02062 [Streptococcus gallolyticus]|uniref:Uncharacterized protein n=1 Tax=Streptococcus gallolyticus TaxID=315405 RepID=A0A139R3E5_9STRE|nr:hypothetical protein SGADD02_02062 [Streptococcus gallolyticus]KXU09145.1 hypothetical protein SGADD03_01000 [Streptococcus gallolyticus]
MELLNCKQKEKDNEYVIESLFLDSFCHFFTLKASRLSKAIGF